jgi:hypothetical protein
MIQGQHSLLYGICRVRSITLVHQEILKIHGTNVYDNKNMCRAPDAHLKGHAWGAKINIVFYRVYFVSGP